MGFIASLRGKIFIAIFIMLLMVVAAAQYTIGVVDRISSNADLLGLVSRLETSAERLQAQATNYKQNAPRDYESYNRDLLVYYENLRVSLDGLALLIPRIVAQMTADENLLLGAHDGQMQRATEKLLRVWQSFDLGVESQLGNDPEAPRLEWAAEYIIRDEPSLYPAISSAITDIRAGIASERDMLKRNGTVVTIVMAAVALVVLGWFSWRIVGRIRRAQTGIREVANGNFNARIDDRSRDELGVLAQDFNALAERMRMVLSLLDGLSDSQARQQALQVIFDESQPYLRTNSLVLIEAQISGRLVISAVAPARDGEVLQGMQLDAHDSLAGLALDTGEPVLLSGLRQHIVQNAHARLVRELTRRLGVASVLAVPIRSERGWLGVLVFGASHEQAFDADKAALMHNLGAVLSHGLDTGQEAPVGGDDRVIPLSGRA